MTDRHPDGDAQRLQHSAPAPSETGCRVAPFVADLRRLRSDAGQPSFRTMSATAHYSHTALSGALSGGRLPSLDLTLAFVRACGGDEEEWRARWTAENARINPTATSDPTGGPAQRLRRIPRTALAAVFVVVLAGAVALTVVALHHLGRASVPNRSIDASTAATAGSPSISAEVAGDKTAFVADTTMPDGSTVQVGESFVKTWDIRNTGTVTWKGRYLQRIGATGGFGICGSLTRVPIPLTRPGEDVQISVTLVAPSLPGSCRTDWKMVDATGRYFFPHEHSVYTIINVSDLGQGPDQSH
ncbi:MAG: NBR1-Ig-like domain-containing protein [Pseudonocardiaceae bacterium]